MALALLIAIGFIHEAITIGIIADPEVISKYPFGSEHFARNSNYSSPESYAWSTLCYGLIFLALAISFVFSFYQRFRRLLKVSYLGLFIFLLYSVLGSAGY